MSKAAMNLQDSFLNQVRRENSEVRVLLVNGTLLRGTVKGFDNFTLILNNRNGQHLIYKHAVAQIVTQRPHPRGDEFGQSDAPQQQELDASAEKQELAETPSGGAARQGGQGENQGHRSKPKKEGFNKLDLSQVKLGESEKG